MHLLRGSQLDRPTLRREFEQLQQAWPRSGLARGGPPHRSQLIRNGFGRSDRSAQRHPWLLRSSALHHDLNDPRVTREGLSVIPLGHQTYLAAKAKGEIVSPGTEATVIWPAGSSRLYTILSGSGCGIRVGHTSSGFGSLGMHRSAAGPASSAGSCRWHIVFRHKILLE
jgi:hypothetical protein